MIVLVVSSFMIVLVYYHEATDQEAALGNGLTIRPCAKDKLAQDMKELN